MAELWRHGPVELPHTFELDGVTLTIPEQPITKLVHWLATGSWWPLFPFSVSDEDFAPLALRQWDEDDPLDYEHYADVAITIFGRMTGMATTDGSNDGFWPGQRLANTALQQWPFYAAWCASKGIGPLQGPLHQVITAMHGWMIDRAGPDQADKLQQQLYGPSPYERFIHPDQAPRHIRDSEAQLALAALQDVALGGEVVTEWSEHRPQNTPEAVNAR